MISILSILALDAYGQAQVPPGGDIQLQLDIICEGSCDPSLPDCSVQPGATASLTLLQGTHVIPSDTQLIYPPPDCANRAFARNLVIQGAPGGTVVVASPVTTPRDLFRFEPGPDITFRGTDSARLVIRGPEDNDPGIEDLDFELDAPEAGSCTSGGGRSRGIIVTGNTGSDPDNYVNLTVEDTEFRCLDSPTSGGAILIEGGSLTAIDSVFFGNTARGVGGAVAIRDGISSTPFNIDPTVPTLYVDEGTRFISNFAGSIGATASSGSGGAIFNDQPGNATIIDDSYFLQNSGSEGAGAVDLRRQASVSIHRNQFDNQNNASRALREDHIGGSVAVRGSESGGDATFDFRNNIVCGSWAGQGGGVYVDSVGTVDVVNSVFAENGAIAYGGGLYLSDTEGVSVDARVVNNTFAGNEAGRFPPFVDPDGTLLVIGGGGSASFRGVNPVFQNNVVAYSAVGGGIFGDYVPFSVGGFEIGDELSIYNNLFFNNSDGLQDIDITGDFASLAFHPSNIRETDPGLLYLGLGEFDCTPEAFYPVLGSPTIDSGGGEVDASGIPGTCVDRVDTSSPPDFIADIDDGPCDIGAFGGEFALWRKDTDGDGVANLFDCDDNNQDINPSVQDVCDFFDNDCDGIVDNGADNQWFPDLDQDGRGDVLGTPFLSCGDPGNGSVPNRDDCNDQDATIFSGASEVCDSKDNDCNDLIDDGLTFTLYYSDQDGDGFGGLNGVESCDPPTPASVTTTGDCADNDPARFPGAPELCDGIDNDCDGFIDADDEDATGVQVYYPDMDGDGYGDGTLETRRCSGDPPPNSVTIAGDCDDGNAEINAGAQELCGNVGVDEDCDGQVDEIDANTVDALEVFQDADGDGIGSSTVFQLVCEQVPPEGFVIPQGDCDDADELVGECSSCGCSAGTLSPVSGMAFGFGLVGLLLRRRRD